MTLPDRLITTARDDIRALNELIGLDIIQAVIHASDLPADTSADAVTRDGATLTLTGPQLAALAKSLSALSSAASRAAHRDALAEADERWRERLDLAVEAMRLYPGERGHRPLAALAEILAVGGPETNLHRSIRQGLGIRDDLAGPAADAAIEDILAALRSGRASETTT